MKKFKKLGLAILCGIGLMSVASCTTPCEIKTTDASGNQTSLSVHPTSNTEEVVEVIEALSENKVDPATYEMLTATVKGEFKAEGEKFKADDNINATLKVSSKAASYDITIKGDNTVTSTGLLGGEKTTTSSIDFNTKITAQSDGVYAEIKLGKDGTPYKAVCNEETFKTVMNEYVGLDFEELIKSIPTSTTDLINEFTNGANLTKEELINVVKNSNITIKSTTSDTITFSFEVKVSEKVSLPVNVTVNPSNGYISEITIDAKDAVAMGKYTGDVKSCEKCYFTIHLSYSKTDTINTITNKSEYSQLETVLSGLILAIKAKFGDISGFIPEA